eukprot:365330-Chlamydomonas_euryale.AAC.4
MLGCSKCGQRGNGTVLPFVAWGWERKAGRDGKGEGSRRGMGGRGGGEGREEVTGRWKGEGKGRERGNVSASRKPG